MPQTRHPRERRFRTGIAALAFNGLDQCGFLAADIAAKAGTDLDIKREICAKKVVSQIAFFPGLLDGRVQPVFTQVVFPPAVDVALVGPTAKPAMAIPSNSFGGHLPQYTGL